MSVPLWLQNSEKYKNGDYYSDVKKISFDEKDDDNLFTIVDYLDTWKVYQPFSIEIYMYALRFTEEEYRKIFVIDILEEKSFNEELLSANPRPSIILYFLIKNFTYVAGITKSIKLLETLLIFDYKFNYFTYLYAVGNGDMKMIDYLNDVLTHKEISNNDYNLSIASFSSGNWDMINYVKNDLDINYDKNDKNILISAAYSCNIEYIIDLKNKGFAFDFSKFMEKCLMISNIKFLDEILLNLTMEPIELPDYCNVLLNYKSVLWLYENNIKINLSFDDINNDLKNNMPDITKTKLILEKMFPNYSKYELKTLLETCNKLLNKSSDHSQSYNYNLEKIKKYLTEKMK